MNFSIFHFQQKMHSQHPNIFASWFLSSHCLVSPNESTFLGPIKMIYQMVKFPRSQQQIVWIFTRILQSDGYFDEEMSSLICISHTKYSWHQYEKNDFDERDFPNLFFFFLAYESIQYILRRCVWISILLFS